VKESVDQRNDVEALRKMHAASRGAGRALAALGLGAAHVKESPSAALQHISLARAGLTRRPEFQTVLNYYESIALSSLGYFEPSSELLKQEITSGRAGDGWIRALYSILLINLVRQGDNNGFLTHYESFSRRFPAARRYQKFAVRFAKALDSRPMREGFVAALESLSQSYPYTAESQWAFRRLLSLQCEDDPAARKAGFSRDLLVSLGRNGELDEGIPDLVGTLLQGPLRDGRRGTRRLDPVELIESLNRSRRGAQALEMALAELNHARLWRDEKLEQRLLIVLVRIYFNQQDYLSADRMISTIRTKFPALLENQKLRELLAENYSRLGSHRLAAGEYGLLSGRHPGNPMYPWLEFWSLYRAGLFPEASAVAARSNFGGSLDREDGADIRYWQSRMRFRTNPEAARAQLSELIAQKGDSYYAIMASLRLGQEINPVAAAPAPNDHSRPVQSAIEVDDSIALDELRLAGLFLDARMVEAARFQMAGISWADQDEEESMVLGQFAFAVDNFRAGLSAANRMASDSGARPRSLEGLTKDRASRAVWRLLYPFAYAPMVETFARQAGIDKFFVLSIMRTESHYNPEAQSPVGAQGLMQIMPATAVRLARLLGDPGFAITSLREPKVSVAYGTYYLWKLLRYYQGNYGLAAAAYNAGPIAVNVWLEACRGCEMDEFVESIPYRETRRYVKTVLKNLVTYRSIYAGTPFSSADVKMPTQLAEGEILF
jgi:soluble lytic murein transglycosylase-like protein